MVNNWSIFRFLLLIYESKNLLRYYIIIDIYFYKLKLDLLFYDINFQLTIFLK